MVQDGIRRKEMAEYQHFDGETYITFNIVYATEKEVQLAVTNRGTVLRRPRQQTERQRNKLRPQKMAALNHRICFGELTYIFT